MRKFLLTLCPVLSYALSPPDLFSVATGAYDIMRPKWRTWQFDMEYKFHVKRWEAPTPYLEFRPLVGMFVTARGSGYIYAGLNFDLLFAKHILFAPGFAAGYYWQGSGKDLGYPLEFRSGVELAWQFDDGGRFGAHFYHLSNASIGRKNPGEESLVVYYDIPIKRGFPFN